MNDSEQPTLAAIMERLDAMQASLKELTGVPQRVAVLETKVTELIDQLNGDVLAKNIDTRLAAMVASQPAPQPRPGLVTPSDPAAPQPEHTGPWWAKWRSGPPPGSGSDGGGPPAGRPGGPAGLGGGPSPGGAGGPGGPPGLGGGGHQGAGQSNPRSFESLVTLEKWPRVAGDIAPSIVPFSGKGSPDVLQFMANTTRTFLQYSARMRIELPDAIKCMVLDRVIVGSAKHTLVSWLTDNPYATSQEQLDFLKDTYLTADKKAALWKPLLTIAMGEGEDLPAYYRKFKMLAERAQTALDKLPSSWLFSFFVTGLMPSPGLSTAALNWVAERETRKEPLDTEALYRWLTHTAPAQARARAVETTPEPAAQASSTAAVAGDPMDLDFLHHRAGLATMAAATALAPHAPADLTDHAASPAHLFALPRSPAGGAGRDRFQRGPARTGADWRDPGSSAAPRLQTQAAERGRSPPRDGARTSSRRPSRSPSPQRSERGNWRTTADYDPRADNAWPPSFERSDAEIEAALNNKLCFVCMEPLEAHESRRWSECPWLAEQRSPMHRRPPPAELRRSQAPGHRRTSGPRWP